MDNDSFNNSNFSQEPSTAALQPLRAGKRLRQESGIVKGEPKAKRARKQVNCPVCGKQLASNNLAAHKRLHEDVCYDCLYCNLKGSKSLRYLWKHHCQFHSDEKV